MMRINKKKVFVSALILILIVSLGLIYLNNVYLPTKAKSLILNALKQGTGREVTLGAVKFHLFKGLVLRDLKIYDGKDALISLKEASCIFLIPPIFKKKVIIPFISLDSPDVFVARRKDSTFNLQDLFLKKPAAAKAEGGFSVICYRIGVKNGLIRFRDDTLGEPFAKNIENLNLSLYLALPANVKFALKAKIAGKAAAGISASGNYNIPGRQLQAKAGVEGLSPKEFLPYYRQSGLNIPSGLADIDLTIQSGDKSLFVNANLQSENLTLLKEGFSASLNTGIKSEFKYNFQDKALVFSGKAALAGSKLSFLLLPGVIQNIAGVLAFSNTGVSTDKITAELWGIPLEIKGALNNYNDPLVNISLASTQSLSMLQGILKDKFQINLPGRLNGASTLFLNLQRGGSVGKSLETSGALNLTGASLKLDKTGHLFEEINGKIEFSLRGLKWQGLGFKYLDIPYKTSGTLTNFKAPLVQLDLSSKDLQVESDFAVDKKLITFSKLSGRYYNCGFSVSGTLDNSLQGVPMGDLGGSLKVDLQDLKTIFKKAEEKLGKAKLQGLVDTQFTLKGDLSKVSSCAIEAKFSGPSLSAYNCNSDDFSVLYSQSAGIANVGPAHFSLYGGALEAVGTVNFNSENLPYWLSLDIQGARLEKMNFGAKEKSKGISGNLHAQAKINGFSSDLSRLSGAGSIKITEGKLWQLDLFKGLGSVLFVEDFSKIVFNEGSCSFVIKDKHISTEDLALKSLIANLIGSVDLGFDSSIDATLNVEVLDENVPLTGTFKDITTAIIGKAGRFGVIKISGTLKDPKYKFKTAVAVTDIIRGLKDILLENKLTR